MSNLNYAEIYLETCALGYAANVAASNMEDVPNWRTTLRDAAARYSAATGNLSAAERAELESLRRLREGIASLRTELANDRADDGQPMTAALAIETIDALLKLETEPG